MGNKGGENGEGKKRSIIRRGRLKILLAPLPEKFKMGKWDLQELNIVL